MKLNKKKVVVVALAICLAAILSVGTLAWFNAQDDITNKFLVTDSETDADDIFSVVVYETELDANGETTGNVTEAGNTYDNIAPGDVLTKDPTVKNTGKYDQWVRVNVTLSNATNWMSVLTACQITELERIFGGYDATLWQSEGNDNPQVDQATDTVTFTYYLKNKLTPGATATLFTSVTIPEEFDQYYMTYINEFELKVVAEALQADNTGASAYEAFNQHWNEYDF